MDISSQIKQFVQVLLGAQPSIPFTSQQIAAAVDQALTILPNGQQGLPDRERLIRELETMFVVTVGQAKTLDDATDHMPWLEQRKSSISWGYWNRYLLLQKDRLPPKATESLDHVTEQILGRLEDPAREGAWDRRGLIVGNVQSGKTANYIGLICKAADAGYSVIIVLTGLHSSLRAQTQVRLDEGFLGYESHQLAAAPGGRPVVGVGRFDKSLRPSSITSREENGDFKLSVAQQFNITPGGHPLLFVVKKNVPVLTNLLNWVESVTNQQDAKGYKLIHDVPLLMIDDEADNASVDTNEQEFNEDGSPDPDHDPTRINGRIRELLNRFEKRAYVGYTATPFANIFIHESGRTERHGEDLFPKSFIMNLPASSDYVGPALVFGIDANPKDDLEEADGLPLICHIEDFETWLPAKHLKDHKPRYKGEDRLPPSLITAMRHFVLCCAARRARGQVKVHNSMLIHVTKFTLVQDEVYKQVQDELVWLRDRIKRGEGQSKTPVLKDLEVLWRTDSVPTSKEMRVIPEELVEWKDVSAHLLPALEAITLRKINGKAPDVLDYDRNKDTGISVIAIGGDKLSRGLTLEGLSVSYFLRATRMYDTLMQMGRWFGYRPGYLDLCRLHLTEELEMWFRHVTSASEELKHEFDRMVAAGGTPRDYGLKVRSHPVLAVTAQVKMRHGTEISLSYQGTVSETIAFATDDSREKNFATLTAFLQDLGEPSRVSPEQRRYTVSGEARVDTWKGSLIWDDVSAAKIIGLLRRTRTHERAVRANGKLMAEYVEKQRDAVDELVDWTVAVLSSNDSQAEQYPVVGRTLGLIFRDNQSKPGEYYRLRRLVSPRDEGIDIDGEAYRRALKDTRESWTLNPSRPTDREAPEKASGPSLRSQRPATRGLLLIHLLDPKDVNLRHEGEAPFVGLAVSWPGSKNASEVTYRVNNVYYAQEIADSDEEDVE